VISSIDQELILQVLWRMKVLARRLISVTSPLNTVVTGGDLSTLNLYGRTGVSKLAFEVRSGALVALELPADLELKPPRVLLMRVMFGLSKVRILPRQVPPPLKLAPTAS